MLTPRLAHRLNHSATVQMWNHKSHTHAHAHAHASTHVVNERESFTSTHATSIYVGTPTYTYLYKLDSTLYWETNAKHDVNILDCVTSEKPSSFAYKCISLILFRLHIVLFNVSVWYRRMSLQFFSIISAAYWFIKGRDMCHVHVKCMWKIPSYLSQE